MEYSPNRFSASQKFPAFYGTRRFITAFTSARTPVRILSQLDPVHAPISHFLLLPYHVQKAFIKGNKYRNVSCFEDGSRTGDLSIRRQDVRCPPQRSVLFWAKNTNRKWPKSKRLIKHEGRSKRMGCCRGQLSTAAGPLVW